MTTHAVPAAAVVEVVMDLARGSEPSGICLLEVALTAPVVGLNPDEPHLLHAVEMNALIHGWDTGHLTAACGANGMRLLSERMAGQRVLPWPPSTRHLAPARRCPTCWTLTGRKRPRCHKGTP
jgi:hypothetical protein